MGKKCRLWGGMRRAAAALARQAAPLRTIFKRGAAWAAATPRRTAFAVGIPLGMLAVWLALWGMQKSLAGRPEYQIPLGSISWEPIPAWLSPRVASSLAAAVSDAGRERSASVFDAGLAERVGKRLEAVPWVRRVSEVRKDGPGKLSIRVEWREPALVVQEKGAFLLDREGCVLPAEGYCHGVLGLPVLTGVGFSARNCPPLPKNRVLQTVYEILDLYARERLVETFPQARIQSIDVSNLTASRGTRFRAPGQIVLETVSGVSIFLTDGSGPGRILLAEQIANLREVLGRDPQLSTVREYVDVRFEKPACR